MSRPLACCISLLGLLSLPAAAQKTEAPNAIPVFHTAVPPHLLATQFTLTAGTGRLSRSDRPLFSVSGEVKGMYSITGALYLSTGAGISHLHSQSRPPDGSPGFKRGAWRAYFPSGIGFSMGDDHASIITGIDVLPGFFVQQSPKSDRQRVFGYGLGPEFGFLFRAGPRNHKGLLIGMLGKLHFLQSPDLNDGPGLRYAYGGMGLVVRFY